MTVPTDLAAMLEVLKGMPRGDRAVVLNGLEPAARAALQPILDARKRVEISATLRELIAQADGDTPPAAMTAKGAAALVGVGSAAKAAGDGPEARLDCQSLVKRALAAFGPGR